MRRARSLLGKAPARTALAVLIGAVILAGVVAFIGVAADWLAATDGIDDAAQRAEEIGRARTVVLAVLGGTLAAIGAYYTHRTFGLNRQGQITERFTRAVDQLGNRESMDVRLGGIYALERIARESPDDHGPIVDILTAFVRERTPIPPADVYEELVQHMPESYPEPPKADVQAALTVLGRRAVSHDPPSPWQLNLSACFLPRANLQAAQLDGANLSYTDFTQALLSGANLARTDLTGAHLYEANLTGARLPNATLRQAFANRATLLGAQLESANLQYAKLHGAYMRSAVLRHADLTGADLERADLIHATLEDATLLDANLAHAHLSETRLTDARLTGAKLTDARYNAETTWPGGVDLEAEGATRVKGRPSGGH